MNEEEQEAVKPELPKRTTISRRNFLKSIGAGAASQVIPKWLGHETETEMPTDIVSREELESRYRTNIYDLPEADFPDNYVELEFRRSIAGEPLFQRLESGAIIGLDIILVDSDSVDPEVLTDDQREFMSQHSFISAGLNRKVEEVRELNRQEIIENRDRMRSEYQQKLEELEASRSSLSSDEYSVELQALNYMYGRYLSDEPSPQDLKEIGIRGYASMDGTGRNDRGETGPRSFIFLAVRDKESEVTFSSEGVRKTISSNRIPYEASSGAQFAPNPEQSYPGEGNFRIVEDPNSNGYVVVGGHTPGFIFRHEASHARGVFVEEDADRVALQGIVDASIHMQDTGSDEKYWVVFRTPEGVTLTKRRAGGAPSRT